MVPAHPESTPTSTRPTVADLAPADARAREHLDLLVSEWQVISDLSFGDLVLWVPRQDSDEVYALAQARPFTSQTTLLRDVTGFAPRAELKPLIQHTLTSGQPNTTGQDPDDTHALGVALWPVRIPADPEDADTDEGEDTGAGGDEVVAVISVHFSPNSRHMPSQLEEVYRDTAQDLLTMVACGRWPNAASRRAVTTHNNPRVGDGAVRLDAASRVIFASPNAVSGFRKLGIRQALEGNHLAEVTFNHLDPRRVVPENMTPVLSGKANDNTDIMTRQVALTVRSIPLIDRVGERFGALLLVRDVTEVRQRDEQLIGKDATIREIHHRVKNNLQTVGSLLRMQARRMDSPEARHELNIAMGRVDTIALVHEALSHSVNKQVNLDDLLQRQFRLAVELASTARPVPVTPVNTGSFGHLPADLATPLALVVNELATNAVEHGTDPATPGGGTVRMSAQRTMGTGTGDLDVPGMLTVSIEDEGRPGHEPFTGRRAKQAASASTTSGSGGLGTEIVRTLVQYDLGGSITWEPVSPGESGSGTRVTIFIPIDEY